MSAFLYYLYVLVIFLGFVLVIYQSLVATLSFGFGLRFVYPLGPKSDPHCISELSAVRVLVLDICLLTLVPLLPLTFAFGREMFVFQISFNTQNLFNYVLFQEDFPNPLN